MKHEIKLSTIDEFLKILAAAGGGAAYTYISAVFKEAVEAVSICDAMTSIKYLYPDADHHFVAHIFKNIGVNVINDMEDDKNA